MFYEEKLIEGILFCKTSPKGEWKQCCIHNMSARIVEQEKEIRKLKLIIHHGLGEEDLKQDI